MRTPKEYQAAAKNENLPLELIGDVIYSFNKRAKNMRDKEREYRNRGYRVSSGDKYDSEGSYCEKKETYYEKKEQMLSFFTPSCIHVTKRKMTRTIDEKEIMDYEALEGYQELNSFAKWDAEYMDYVRRVRITFTETDYYEYYEIGPHTFHRPIDYIPANNALPIVNLNELTTFGEDIGNLLSVQFCDKILQGLISGQYRIINTKA